jgi:flagellar biosynthesis/type III secretory pathway protein FliH
MDEVIEKGHNILDNTVKNEEEMEIYEMKLKAEMDYNSNIDNAMKKGKEEGKKEGIEKGIEEGIIKGKKEGKEETIIMLVKKK